MRHRRYPFVTGFLALPLLLYLVYVILPYAQAVAYSFTDWRGYSDRREFVGLDNYARLLHDELVRKALWHNVFFLVTVPLATILLALFFAFLLNVGGRGGSAGVREVRGSRFYKVVFFFPQTLSIAIIAVLWQALYRTDRQGLLNRLLIELHLVDPEHPLRFTQDSDTWMWWLLVVVVWNGVGFYMVLFSAAMQSIPRDIYEAALLDGATRADSFFRITLPLLRDNVTVAWVYLGFVAMDLLALVFVLAPQQGGPYSGSETLASMQWYNAFNRGRFGYACAMGVAMAIFSLLLAAVQMTAIRRERIEF